jgi:hypothetical protein
LNRTVIVLTNPEMVKAILDGQGALTGNRPRSHIVQRVTDGLNMALENMGKSIAHYFFYPRSELLTDCLKNADTPIWKHSRKAIHLFMSPSQLETYLPKQQVEYIHFLHDILMQPQVSPP